MDIVTVELMDIAVTDQCDSTGIGRVEKEHLKFYIT